MIRIIDTGVANIRSLQAALDRLQQPHELTTGAGEIESASHVILPGVGAFAAAMRRIDELNLRRTIRARIESGEPTLCICLGMQLLCQGSSESPGVAGLGVIAEEISRFSDAVKVPQLGWNTVQPADDDGTAYFPPGQAYFANSYRLVQPPAGWQTATTGYDGPFVSSLWKERVLACQFHPELSGTWGERLIESWILGRREQRGESC